MEMKQRNQQNNNNNNDNNNHSNHSSNNNNNNNNSDDKDDDKDDDDLFFVRVDATGLRAPATSNKHLLIVFQRGARGELHPSLEKVRESRDEKNEIIRHACPELRL
jgi:hypothetical protein